jgi:hypothetical protein
MSQDPDNDLIPMALDSVLLINFTTMQKLVCNAFNDTIVEHAGVFGIPFIVLISGITNPIIHFVG